MPPLTIAGCAGAVAARSRRSHLKLPEQKRLPCAPTSCSKSNSSAMLHREIELKHGSVGFVRRDPEPAALSPDDGLANRQPHPNAARLGAVKRLQNHTDNRGHN